MSRETWRTIGCAVVGLTLGALVWAFSIAATGHREPFDGDLTYYAITTFLAGACAAFVAPRRWWVAVVAVYLGQHLYAFAAYPDTRAWFLFGLIVNVLLPTWIPAAVGAFSAYAVWRIRVGRRGSTNHERARDTTP